MHPENVGVRLNAPPGAPYEAYCNRQPFPRFGQQRPNVIIKQVIDSDGLPFVVERCVTHRFATRQFHGGREVGTFEMR